MRLTKQHLKKIVIEERGNLYTIRANKPIVERSIAAEAVTFVLIQK